MNVIARFLAASVLAVIAQVALAQGLPAKFDPARDAAADVGKSVV